MPAPFAAYISHADGLPKLDFEGFSATSLAITADQAFEFSGATGAIAGMLTIYRDRAFDFEGLAAGDDTPVEHYATGTCTRMQLP